MFSFFSLYFSFLFLFIDIFSNVYYIKGEGTAGRDAVASNRSAGSCLSNFNKRTSSNK